ncbi:hypothetical protein ACIQ1D_18135 [Lysinibacillus xylanilyticus]|uniref:hypothetical protein n=1 Tax=Lysinibacillus xylanilyticus TaxID=582475 RepID=UPI0038136BCB
MKLPHYIILFIVIYSLPLLFTEYRYQYAKETMYENHKHETGMTTAAHDAVNVLRTNVKTELENGYDSYKINPVNPQPAFETFMKTLSLQYGVELDYSMDRLARYVPAFAIVDYDGLLLNVYKEYKDERGDKVLNRVWLPKIPFSYTDKEGNIINFTIDEEVELYDIDLDEWFEGTRQELVDDPDVTVSFLEDKETFHNVRRTTIVNTLQEHLAYYINEHNVYTKRLDVTYKFMLPYIPKEDWYNTVDDISILAFFQGYPSELGDVFYQKYAFVGTRLQFNDRILAGTVDGYKKFWFESCGYPYAAQEIYSSKKAAAANGYSELSCLNK